ncbi:hypothetical protein Glove_321g43 [Diversispora epigaea]|uniref:Protection of telomeres protein 1 n=1 Tax=Diversispora epigaea TaxID=1348612 RepID=A0A397HNN0_9GLOM|nr:hypothetical protein Glove_321g43 [Diversispora epigaea]
MNNKNEEKELKPIEGYTSLANAVPGNAINVIGVIKSFKAKRKCNGSSDWYCSFVLSDHSLSKGLSVILFRTRREDLPDVEQSGSILVGMKFKVDKFQDSQQLIAYKNDSTCVVFKDKLEEKILPSIMKAKGKAIITFAECLRKWWKLSEIPHISHQKIRKQLKINELEINVFCDLVGEILHARNTDITTELFITDYTENEYLNTKTMDWDPPNGLSGKQILQVSLWDENRLEGRNLQVGAIVMLQNVRTKFNNYQMFQAIIHGDPDTRRVKISELDSLNPDVIELKKRKKHYIENHLEVQAKSSQNNLVSFSKKDSLPLEHKEIIITKVVNCQIDIKSITEILKKKEDIYKYRTRGRIIQFYPLNYQEFIKPYCRKCDKIFFEHKPEIKFNKCPTCFKCVKYIYDFWLLIEDEKGDATIPVLVNGKHAICFLRKIEPQKVKENIEVCQKFKDLINTLLGANNSKTTLMDFCIAAYIDRNSEGNPMTYHLINTVLL